MFEKGQTRLTHAGVPMRGISLLLLTRTQVLIFATHARSFSPILFHNIVHWHKPSKIVFLHAARFPRPKARTNHHNNYITHLKIFRQEMESPTSTFLALMTEQHNTWGNVQHEFGVKTCTNSFYTIVERSFDILPN